MASHIALPSGQLVNISDIYSVGPLDASNPPAGRQHSVDGTLANNFIGGAIVEDVPIPVRYGIVFRSAGGRTDIIEYYATSGARDTALDAIKTSLTT